MVGQWFANGFNSPANRREHENNNKTSNKKTPGWKPVFYNIRVRADWLIEEKFKIVRAAKTAQ